uniref:RNA-dependent RNA polymerase n=1 Tax=Chromera velia CCMP2878 TaxID=1169474 RepID=A0A0G4HU35_9ALVE|eukprot:Cvel_8564.t1-p1 / transcript=Cvel_8564.t1 / gene=Cvel_8564 / organism=Chromera_velia_CCMP2878 / gene_product=Probable RNA-dependent RNA polymerase 1, putative / transcript_product=Probable RNA-dependent RNA polymerase 1, putative / location=Cvel_scaffold475:30880-37164(+) / protein_length=892 / sequence_SO=supercontig / SO=protein_coding / is_pseudo=false
MSPLRIAALGFNLLCCLVIRPRPVVLAGSFHFFPLGVSENNVREGGVWFAGQPISRGPIDVERLARECGFMGSNYSVKGYLRFGLLFSRGEAVGLPRDFEWSVVPDVERNGFVFTDGNGTAGPGFFRYLREELAGRSGGRRFFFTTVQIRWAGFKGTLTIDPTLRPYQVKFVKSMKKFEASKKLEELPRPMHILYHAEVKPAKISLQLMLPLRALGVPSKVFTSLQTQELGLLRELEDPTVLRLQYERAARQLKRAGFDGKAKVKEGHARLLKAGLPISCNLEVVKDIQNSMMSRIRCVVKGADGNIKTKFRLSVVDAEGKPRAWYGMAAIDRTGILKHGEVFVKVPHDLPGSGRTERRPLTGRIAIWKHPIYKAAGVRTVIAVDDERLHHYESEIVFSAQGPSPKLSEASGADADGDLIGFTNHPDLIPQEEKIKKTCRDLEEETETVETKEAAAAESESVVDATQAGGGNSRGVLSWILRPLTLCMRRRRPLFNDVHWDLTAELHQNSLGLVDWQVMQRAGLCTDENLEGEEWNNICEVAADLAQDALDVVKTGKAVTREHIKEKIVQKFSWPRIKCDVLVEHSVGRKCVWDFMAARDEELALINEVDEKKQCVHKSHCFLASLVEKAVEHAEKLLDPSAKDPEMAFLWDDSRDPLEALWQQETAGGDLGEESADARLKRANDFFFNTVRPKSIKAMRSKPENDRERVEKDKMEKLLGIQLPDIEEKTEEMQASIDTAEAERRGDVRMSDIVQTGSDLKWTGWDDFIQEARAEFLEISRQRAAEREDPDEDREAERFALACYMAQKRGRKHPKANPKAEKEDRQWPMKSCLWFPHSIACEELVRMLERENATQDDQPTGAPESDAAVHDWFVEGLLDAAALWAACCVFRE